MSICYSMDPKADVAAVREKCIAAEKEGYSYICLPQWFVSTAADELKGKATGVATIVSLPGGTTSPDSKYAEAKWAIANGVGLIIFPVNMELLKAGDLSAAKSDLDAALVACKTANGRKSGVKAAALIDGMGLDEATLRAAAGFCVASGVCAVIIAHNEKAVEALKGEFPAVEAF